MRNNFFQNLITLGRLVFLRTEKSMANTQNPPQNLMRGRAIIGAGLAILLILTTAACGTLDNPDVIDNGGYGTAPTAAPVTVDPTAVPPTPTAPSILPTQTGTIPFTSYYPVGFTGYVEQNLPIDTKPLPPGETSRVEPNVVVVVVNPQSEIGRTFYCAVDSYQNSQTPPFDYNEYPVGDGTTSATTCLEGPRLVRVGENLYQVQVDPYGTVATVSLDDDLAQSATPYVFAVRPDGFVGDSASGIVGQQFLDYVTLGFASSSAERRGPALVEGVVLAPAPVE